RTETLRPGVVNEHIRHDVPRHIRAALEPRIYRMEVFSIDIGGRGGRVARSGTRLVTVEAAGDRTFFVIDETVIARSSGDRKHFGNEVEIQRREKRRLPVPALDIIEKSHIVVACARVVYAR